MEITTNGLDLAKTVFQVRRNSIVRFRSLLNCRRSSSKNSPPISACRSKSRRWSER